MRIDVSVLFLFTFPPLQRVEVGESKKHKGYSDSRFLIPPYVYL